MQLLTNKKRLLLLFGIVAIGFFLRVYQLSHVPAGFHADEAAFGYNAYSILHTGRDEYGKFLPLVLKSFGDYKGALYAYIVVPFIAVIGLTPLAVRLPSAVIDTGTIILLYFFVKNFLKNEKIALIASFLYAISPWSIDISRVSGDVTSAIFFSVLLSYAIQKFVQSRKWEYSVLSVVAAAGAILAYAPFRFFVVLIAGLFFLVSIQKDKRKKIGFDFDKRAFSIVSAFLILGVLYTFIASIARFNQISIFTTPQTQLVLNEQIREDQYTPVLVTRVFHNKIINYSRTILENAQAYFTLDFLALNGGFPLRERISGVGLFYLWEMAFLLVGLFLIIKKRKRDELFFILWWILLLTPTFFTFDEVPNIHRTLIVLPAMAVIIAVGMYEIFQYRKKVRRSISIVIFAVFILAAIYELFYFSHQYFVHFNVHQPWNRGYAYKPLSADLEKLYGKYNKIIITKTQSSPYIYLLFYTKYDPELYQKQGSPRDLDYSEFGKYEFVPLDCPLNGGKDGDAHVKGKPGILYVDNGTCTTPTHNTKLIDTVHWMDSTPAFKVMEYVATGDASMNPEF